MLDVAGPAAAVRSPLDELRAAIAFLTRIPIGVRPEAASSTGAAAFPLVGAALGGGGAVPLVVLGPSHPVIAAILAVAVVAIVDGGLHLDGLADTIDALAAPAGGAERARTDPRVGSAGAAGIVVVLALEVAAAAELASRGPAIVAAAFVSAAAVSRAFAPVLARTVGRRSAAGTRLGAWFAERVGTGATLVAAVLAALIVASAAIGTSPALGAGVLVGAIVAAAVVLATVRARAQLDGDGYGFAIEATFALVLVGSAVAT